MTTQFLNGAGYRRLLYAVTIVLWVAICVIVKDTLGGSSQAAPASPLSFVVPGGLADGKVIPSTVVTENNASDGRVRIRTTKAVRSDGSDMMLFELYWPGISQVAREIRLASGEIIGVDDIRQLKARGVSIAEPGSLLRDPDSNCLKDLRGAPAVPGEQFEGEATVDGYRTFIVRDPKRREWRAPALGCAVVKVVEEGQATRVTAVIPGEPAASLFEIPESYRLVPPSRMLRPWTPQESQPNK